MQNSGILRESVERIMRGKKEEDENDRRFRLEIFEEETKRNASLRFVQEDRLEKMDKEEVYPTSVSIV